MLKTKRVNIEGVEYEFREPTVEQMLPVLGKLQDEEGRFAAQVDILKLTVFKDGNAVGDQDRNIEADRVRSSRSRGVWHGCR